MPANIQPVPRSDDPLETRRFLNILRDKVNVLIGSGTSITAAGSDTEVQFNSSGLLAADPDFTFNTVDNSLTVTGSLNVGVSNFDNVLTSSATTVQLALDELDEIPVLWTSAQTGGVQNIFVGETGNTTNTGTNNVLLGHDAGGSMNSSNNVMIGNDAGKNNTGTTGQNTFVGALAGTSSGTCIRNVMVGYESGNIATGASNVYVGYRSGRRATGNSNTVVGYSSLTSTSASGGSNTGMGSNALQNLTTGSSNTTLGSFTAFRITTGGSNTVIGAAAGDNITTGGDNTILGHAAARSLTTEGGNTVIGHDAYRAGVANNNTVIGNSAGYNLTGDGNVLLGKSVANSQTAISDELWIHNSDVADPLIWGDFSTLEAEINGGFTVNAASGDYDFVVKKNTSGDHIVCDAGLDTIALDGTTITTTGIHVSTGRRYNVSSVSTSTTLTHNTDLVEQTATGITTTLWASPTTGDRIEIRNKSGGNNTLAGNGVNIEGATTQTIYDDESFELVYDGTEWTV